MKIGIMQPYFFPYIGYFQLLNAVDKWVVYDNIKYTKKGWINRNRLLQNGKDAYFTIPLKNDSDFLNIDQRQIACDFNRNKILNQFKSSYSKAQNYKSVIGLVEDVLEYENLNLFRFLLNSINAVCRYLDISTEIIISSSLKIDHTLKSEKKVLAICKELGAATYINAIGGQELYTFEEFSKQGIELKFLKTTPLIYKQFENEFAPNLSIIDVIMFNEKEKAKEMLLMCDLV